MSPQSLWSRRSSPSTARRTILTVSLQAALFQFADASVRIVKLALAMSGVNTCCRRCREDRPRVSITAIPRGYVGTLRTVEHVIGLIKGGAKDFFVRQTAIAI